MVFLWWEYSLSIRIDVLQTHDVQFAGFLKGINFVPTVFDVAVDFVHSFYLSVNHSKAHFSIIQQDEHTIICTGDGLNNPTYF